MWASSHTDPDVSLLQNVSRSDTSCHTFGIDLYFILGYIFRRQARTWLLQELYEAPSSISSTANKMKEKQQQEQQINNEDNSFRHVPFHRQPACTWRTGVHVKYLNNFYKEKHFSNNIHLLLSYLEARLHET